MLRSDLCDYSDSYIVVKLIMNVVEETKSQLTIITFHLCISKINTTFLDNAEDLDFVMPMDDLLEYSDNYSKTSGSLWNYYRDEINDDENENDNSNRLNNDKTITSKSFKYKTKIIESTPDNENRLNAEVFFP